MVIQLDTRRARSLAPLDPDLVRFVEALADAAAQRDHHAALAGRNPAMKAKR